MQKTEFLVRCWWIGFLSLFFAQLACAADATLDLPMPDGCYAIGTTTIWLQDNQRNRDLLVTLWYPATPGQGAVAPYMDKKTANAIAQEWGLQPGFETHIRTNARRLPPFAAGGPFPVVLLEHGSNVLPAIYTVLAEGLASMGFIVAATNHPPDSMIAALLDGRDLKFAPYWPEKADRRTQGITIWRFGEYVILPDVRFVLDRLTEMNAHDDLWRGRMDLSRIGIVGHSMGGLTAGLATQKEPRIVAGVNLDGSTFPGQNDDIRPIKLHKPFMSIVTPEHAANPATQVREYLGSPSNSYYAEVTGTTHMSFTDKHMILSRFSPEPPVINGDFNEIVNKLLRTRSLVEAFFGKYLRGDMAPVLDVDVHFEKK
jgi:predicted dienelactone hydrolase